MKDRRKNNGGARPNSGRKPKADELTIIENMDKALAPLEAWKSLALRVKEGDTQAIRLWLNYRFGMPKQSVDLTTKGESMQPISAPQIDLTKLSLEEKKALRDIITKSRETII